MICLQVFSSKTDFGVYFSSLIFIVVVQNTVVKKFGACSHQQTYFTRAQRETVADIKTIQIGNALPEKLSTILVTDSDAQKSENTPQK
jgi:uncharacterized membrane protein YoaK (UPF0700 family)